MSRLTERHRLRSASLLPPTTPPAFAGRSHIPHARLLELKELLKRALNTWEGRPDWAVEWADRVNTFLPE